VHPNPSARVWQQRRIREHARDSDAYGFFNLLTGPELFDQVESLLPQHRERLFPPTETLSMFLARYTGRWVTAHAPEPWHWRGHPVRLASTESLYAALNWRRLATASTSGSTTPAFALIDDTIFSFFLLDIGYLPFDSNFTKVGVSRHIGTNGQAARQAAHGRGAEYPRIIRAWP